MERPSKVHCFFEQSGTFKREFIKIGIPAEDYDIQNHFGETDHVIDLFAEIEAAYDGRASVFDGIGGGDLIMAFFPCTYFETIQMCYFQLTHYNNRHKPKTEKIKDAMKRLTMRTNYHLTLYKLLYIAEAQRQKLIIENPATTPSYLVGAQNFPNPTIIDNDRSLRGDYYRKPTAYWFVNCVPMRSATTQADKRLMRILDMKSSPRAGICSEERSMMSPDYARNFIADFILGVPLSPSAYQQGELPLGLEAVT